MQAPPWPLPRSFCVGALHPSLAVHLHPKNIRTLHSRCQNLAVFSPAFSCFFRPSLTVVASALIPRDSPAYWISSTTVVLVVVSCLALVRSLFNVVRPDFRCRFNALLREECLADTREIPPHVWQAVVASEDRRFFQHSGIDPRGIARAALSLTAKGGGSTITQQLVKNELLINERKWTRKLVEALLALCIERKMSKWQILWSYLRKIYWGHGVYGIGSASEFYFGKHPSLLTIGESALLSGIIPSPEARSPFKDPNRGKRYQARVLRRMVAAGYIDIDTALWVLNQPIDFSKSKLMKASNIDRAGSLFKEELGYSTNPLSNHLTWKNELGYSTNPLSNHLTWKNVWDWEKESSSWEIWENMEVWAKKHREHMNTIIFLRNKLAYFFHIA